MKIWLDAQLSPALARWMSDHFDVDANHIRNHGLLGSNDREIFEAARSADAVVMTKDRDFVDLLRRHGPPPRIILITCGNTSNARMERVLRSAFSAARALLEKKEPLVEIRDSALGGKPVRR